MNRAYQAARKVVEDDHAPSGGAPPSGNGSYYGYNGTNHGGIGITPLPSIHQRDGYGQQANGGGDYIPPAQQLLSAKHTPRETPLTGRDYPSDHHTPNRRVSLNGESALAMLQLPSQVIGQVVNIPFNPLKNYQATPINTRPKIVPTNTPLNAYYLTGL